MDEWAIQEGYIALEEWPFGLFHSLKRYLRNNLDPDLCMPEDQLHRITNKNIESSYRTMIKDEGGAYVCYTGPGWTGHLTFVDPGAPDFKGDLSIIPSKGAIIGPQEIITAKEQFDWNYFTVGGTNISWQRFVTRHAAHDPVAPYVPTSLHQLLKTYFYISETIVQDITPQWDKAY